MENGASYLHKKFKKQLSVVDQPLKNEKNEATTNKDPTRNVESGKEKVLKFEMGLCNNNHLLQIDNQNIRDNKEIVPKLSTNERASSLIVTTSSISLDIPLNSCISYTVSQNQQPTNEEQCNNRIIRTHSFDTTEFSSSTDKTEPKPTANMSSIFTKTNFVNKPLEDTAPQEIKQEKILPPPDRNPNGKYVCTYCNLVCSKPSVLQKHIRAHTNERPYPCLSCGFSFKTRSNLYKHCRSRTHANRVMGNRAQELNTTEPEPLQKHQQQKTNPEIIQDVKTKPYKPRFHTTASKQFYEHVSTKENIDDDIGSDDSQTNHRPNDLLSHHINEIISKNNSIINNPKSYYSQNPTIEEPLNLTKNRKRCMSELGEPIAQKSLIKELLLKNLHSDMQCPYCKMIFQTVTELELHKLRSCKGKPTGAKYTRSSSVNVASILTQNKNAFDNIPQLQNTVFPLNSPGPFLGKTRLVDSDKCKSFSFEDGLRNVNSPSELSPNYLLSPLSFDKEKKTPVKLFGGEVKITHTTGETKSFKIDNKESEKFDSASAFVEYSGKVSENRVIKSSLQSGGTVLTNKTNYNNKDNNGNNQDVIRVYENSSVSPSIDMTHLERPKFTFDRIPENPETKQISPEYHDQLTSPSYKFTNIKDFSQNAVKMLTPNLKQPKLHLNGFPMPTEKQNFPKTPPVEMEIDEDVPKNFSSSEQPAYYPKKRLILPTTRTAVFFQPVNLLVDGKVVRHVPGIPGPVTPEEPMDFVPAASTPPSPRKISPLRQQYHPTLAKRRINKDIDQSQKILEVKTEMNDTKSKSPILQTPPKKFARPTSLPLKPTTVSLKQHHGLTPTMFNQILISPDTPRVAKKYAQHFLHGNYFSYLGLKSSTKPVYCTLNKTQPFYVPHFKKLSMYSEWRHQDTKTDKLYASAYDSRHRNGKYTIAGKCNNLNIIDSNYHPKNDEVMDLSMATTEKQVEQPPPQPQPSTVIMNGANLSSKIEETDHIKSNNNVYVSIKPFKKLNNEDRYPPPPSPQLSESMESDDSIIEVKTITKIPTPPNNGKILLLKPVQNESVTTTTNNPVNINYVIHEEHSNDVTMIESPKPNNYEYDNSAMEILAEIATKQVKLEKNTLAKSVATEYLKLATKNECLEDGGREQNHFGHHASKGMNDLIVKPEGNKSCTICSKSFSKPSQLRLHMNIHYIERPYRCDPCSVSFRTKGHLQKHERSASHHNKLLSSPALSSSEPRPFKCTDCNIAFRIHGHLAKHLRSKMHIMKLECLAKIPIGLYAELERSNSLLTEINTCDGDQCLESLKTLARKVFINDNTNNLKQLDYTESIDADS